MALNSRYLFLIGGFAFGAGFLAGKLNSRKEIEQIEEKTVPNTQNIPPSRSSLDLRVDYSRIKSEHESSTGDALEVGIDGVFRLVLTGGPCAGKSTIISTLSYYLRSKGFAVIHVQETATSLKNGGIHWAPDLSDDFQDCCVSVQSNRENVAVRWAQKLADKCIRKKCIIIYDRGLVDGLAFVTQEVLEKSCINAGISTDLFE